MAIFFKSLSPGGAADKAVSEESRQIRWWNVAAFVAVLIILLVFAYLSGQNDKLQLLYNALVHGVEVLFGLFAGIFIGEANK